jgi:amino acid permease
MDSSKQVLLPGNNITEHYDYSINSDLSGKLNPESQKIGVGYAAIALFKCVVGTGSFFIPYGVLQGGLYGGFAGLIGIGLCAVYLNWIIMDAKTKTFANKPVSYNHLTEALWGPWAGILLSFFIL